MPIFRINDQLHYFAHVPKCGGTSVESYLTERFGPLALRDLKRFRFPPDQRWARTSPQHVPATTLANMIPADWLVSSFAVVRHPVRRALSAFHYARDKNGHIPLATGFNTWFRSAASWIGTDPFRSDSHFAPQTSFVPDGSQIFRLEDGLDQIIPYLDRLAGKAEGPRSLPSLNVGGWREDDSADTPDAETLGLIHQVYAEDFTRFGYTRAMTTTDLARLPDLPALAATGQPPAPPPRSLQKRILRSLMRRAGM